MIYCEDIYILLLAKIGIFPIHEVLVEVERSSGKILNVLEFCEILPVEQYTLRKIPDGLCWLHINVVAYDKNDHTLIVFGQAQGGVKVAWDK